MGALFAVNALVHLVCNNLVQVISPVMGWVRHYHAYAFHAGKDGAVFGPANSAVSDCSAEALGRLRAGDIAYSVFTGD